MRQTNSAVKQRGREKKGPPDIAPKSFSQKRPKWCSVPSTGVIGKSALEIGHFLRWISGWFLGAPSSPGPFGLLLTNTPKFTPSHPGKDQPHRNTTQNICTRSLGMTALLTYHSFWNHYMFNSHPLNHVKLSCQKILENSWGKLVPWTSLC